MKDSVELMSGIGTPERTAMPIDDLTRSTRLPGTTSPDSVSLSREERDRIMMSAASPRANRDGIESGAPPDDAPYEVMILMPVIFSNSGARILYAAVNPPDVMTRISGVFSAASPSPVALFAEGSQEEKKNARLINNNVSKHFLTVVTLTRSVYCRATRFVFLNEDSSGISKVAIVIIIIVAVMGLCHRNSHEPS